MAVEKLTVFFYLVYIILRNIYYITTVLIPCRRLNSFLKMLSIWQSRKVISIIALLFTFSLGFPHFYTSRLIETALLLKFLLQHPQRKATVSSFSYYAYYTSLCNFLYVWNFLLVFYENILKEVCKFFQHPNLRIFKVNFCSCEY